MHSHTVEYLGTLALDRNDLESEGLGLRPLSTVDGLPKAPRIQLARRYHRIAQWTETLQGSYWLTVRMRVGGTDDRIRIQRCIGTTRWHTSWMNLGFMRRSLWRRLP
jgi:hypothetical protein